MQSNAVLQFETWSREESSFRAASLNADRERKRLEESLKQLRAQQKQLSNDTRESADLLGRFHRDCGLLEKEKERLLFQLKEERSMLQRCSQDSDDLLSKGTFAKSAFHQKVESLQTELKDMLHHQENGILQTMTNAATMAPLQNFISELYDVNKNENISEFLDILKAWKAVADLNETLVAEIDLTAKDINELRSRAFAVGKPESNMNVRAMHVESTHFCLNEHDLTFNSILFVNLISTAKERDGSQHG
jgi:chromosome segregation ATPase